MYFMWINQFKLLQENKMLQKHAIDGCAALSLVFQHRFIWQKSSDVHILNMQKWDIPANLNKNDILLANFLKYLF